MDIKFSRVHFIYRTIRVIIVFCKEDRLEAAIEVLNKTKEYVDSLEERFSSSSKCMFN